MSIKLAEAELALHTSLERNHIGGVVYTLPNPLREISWQATLREIGLSQLHLIVFKAGHGH